jgi:hypothetical protein
MSGAGILAARSEARLGICILLLFFAAPSERLRLVEETIVVPPGGQQAVGVVLKQRAADVLCSFSVVSEGPRVRLALVRMSPSEGTATRTLAVTAYQKSGGLRYGVGEPGEYAVIVDNRQERRRPAAVALRVSLMFTEGRSGAVRVLSAERRLAVVVLSMLGFLAIVVWSGKRLLRAIREQRNHEPPPPSW